MYTKNSIHVRLFLYYKLINSLFLGLSVGSIFIIYQPLEPSIYSLGGIFLALAMLGIAKLYTTILNRHYFFRISMAIEFLMLALIIYFLLFSYSYMTAMVIYIGYQATFAFGSYLVRAETILLNKAKILTLLDMAKQIGYLAGMLISFLFYKATAYFAVTDAQAQVYYLHFLLLLAELGTIVLLYLAFTQKPD